MGKDIIGSKQAEKPAEVKEQVSMTHQLTWPLFVLRAIRKGAQVNTKTGKQNKGIHVIYSGFREYAMSEFNLDSQQFVARLNTILVNPAEPINVGDGKVVWKKLPENPAGIAESRPARGGVMLYVKGEAGAPRRDFAALMASD